MYKAVNVNALKAECIRGVRRMVLKDDVFFRHSEKLNNKCLVD